jgi:MFS family permease
MIVMRPKLTPPGVVLAALCAMYALMFVNRTNIQIASPVMRADLHLSNTELGLAFSAFALPYALFQLFGGWLGDRFGPRRTLAGSMLDVALATIWIGAAGGLLSLLLARLLLGFGEGAAFPTATRAMAAWTPTERWGFAQGITHTFSRIGNASTALIVAPVIVWLSWRWSFYLLAPVNIVWMAFWFWYFRDDPAAHLSMTEDVLARLPKRAGFDAKPRVPYLRLARFIAPVTVVDFCYGWTLWIFQNWIQSFFVQNFQLDLSTASFYSAGVLFFGVIGDMMGGVATDYILRRTGNVVLARRNVLVAGFLGGALFMLPVIFTHDLNIAALSLSLAFLFSELIVAPIWAVPMDIAPRYAGSASGMMNFGFGIAGIVSPMFFGYMLDVTGGEWTVPFVVSMGLLIIGAALSFTLRPDQPFIEAEAPPRSIAGPAKAARAV